MRCFALTEFGYLDEICHLLTEPDYETHAPDKPDNSCFYLSSGKQQDFLWDTVALVWQTRVPACEVTANQLVEIVRKTSEAGKERTAGIVRAYLCAAFNAAKKAPLDSKLPAALIPFNVTHNPAQNGQARRRDLHGDGRRTVRSSRHSPHL